MNNDLIQYLLATIPNAKLVADNRQILCRCPKCMDSANPTSAHFYIFSKDFTRVWYIWFGVSYYAYRV